MSDRAILLVDDERQTLKYFERAFAKDFTVLTAASADEAEAIVDANPGRIGVLISDQRMPGRNGVSLLNAVRRKHPAIVRMLTTAYSELDDAIEAVNRGEIFRYIVKPWDFDLLRQEINTGLLVYGLQSERDLLIGEKLIARQRMLAVDRARDLAVIVSAVPALKSARLAVDDYVHDCAANFASVPTINDAASLDLWAMPQAEAQHMGSVAAEAARVAEQIAAAAPGTPALGDCLRDAMEAAGAQASAKSVKVVAEQAPAAKLTAPASAVRDILSATLSALVASAQEGGEVRVTTTVDATGVTVSMSAADAARADGLLYGPPAASGKSEPSRLFGAYLAARELGGNIKIGRGAEALTADVRLPLDSKSSPTPAVQANWLEKLFQHFEDWPV